MAERWCIIAGARSGSTWLEEMIFNSFPNDFYQMKLGEPLEHSEDYFKSSGHNHTVMLNPSGFIKLGRLENHIFKDQIEYVDYLIDIFNKGDPRQNLVLKVFPQAWKLPKEQYIRFLSTLEQLGFKFINLDRKITDRAISWQVMQQRKIVHKWNEHDSKFFSTIEGNDTIVEPGVNSINLDIKIFYDYMNLTLNEDTAKNEILKNFNYVNVNYETMVSDCVSNNIPINQITKVQKLYLNEYQLLISNYEEIIDETNKPMFIEKYGKNSSLYNPILESIGKSNIASTICQYAWDYTIWMMSRKELRNCCRAMTHKVKPIDLSKGKDFVKDFIPIIELKKDLLSGVHNDDCKSCWNIENTGGKSPRSGFNNFAKFIKSTLWKDMGLNEIKIRLLNLTEQDREDIININSTRMIEISLGNTCDLKCMYCHPHYSSQWAAEQIKHGELKYFELEPELPKEDDTEFETIWWDWFENHAGHTTRAINFIGGEPLIINKFYKYIDRIINFYDTTDTNQGYIDISIVSNFNTPPKQFEQFLNCVSRLAKHGKFKVDINVSMEQISTRAEFVRTGTDWKLMNENIERFLNFAYDIDPDNIRIIFNAQIALNALCISDLPEFIKFIIDLQRNHMRPINLRQNQISFPQWLSPYILPTSYTKYIDESIELLETEVIDYDKYSHYGRWDSYIHFLRGIKNGIANTDKNNRTQKEFIENIDKLSSRRNLNFAETFPEMIDFYEESKRL
jgi:organic radical activating enzyme